MGAERTRVFISYSHKDTRWLERLKVHLKPYERDRLIDRWDDTRIASGQNWRKEIRNALDEAAVAVLLISADFLASDFIASDELPTILEEAETGSMEILPVILKPCGFRETSRLSRCQSVNAPENPLINLTEGEQEAVWVKVVEDISAALRRQTPEGRLAEARNALESEVRKKLAMAHGQMQHLLGEMEAPDSASEQTDFHRAMAERIYLGKVQEYLEGEKTKIILRTPSLLLELRTITDHSSSRYKELKREQVQLGPKLQAVIRKLDEVAKRSDELKNRCKSIGAAQMELIKKSTREE